MAGGEFFSTAGPVDKGRWREVAVPVGGPGGNHEHRKWTRTVSKCLNPNPAETHLCRHCDAPLTSHAATDPLLGIAAEDHVIRSAVANPNRPIILVGLWLVGPPALAAGAATILDALASPGVETLLKAGAGLGLHASSPDYSKPSPRGCRPWASSPWVGALRPGSPLWAHRPLTPTRGRHGDGLSGRLAGGIRNRSREGIAPSARTPEDTNRGAANSMTAVPRSAAS